MLGLLWNRWSRRELYIVYQKKHAVDRIVMKMQTLPLIFAAMIPMFAGCATHPIVLSQVGPEPIDVEASAPKGYLQVFSETDTVQDGDFTYYYPHTGYNICDQSGKVIQFVPNHVGDMDQSPSIVPVSPGNYRIVAQSSSYGRVTVPVVIQQGRQTVIHLENDWKPSLNATSKQLVYLPDGEAVGWGK